MKKILSFLVFSALAPLFALGQGSQLPRYTVATLPAASSQPHYIVQVIDGASSTDCAVGGGANNVACVNVAGVWYSLGSVSPTITGDLKVTGTVAAGTTITTPNINGANYTIDNPKNNVAIGYQANSLNVGSLDTAFGYGALVSNQGSNNVAIGTNALQTNTTAGSQTAVGTFSQFAGLTGSGNTSVGTYSMFCNSSGVQNVAVGQDALQGGWDTTSSCPSNNTSSNNVAVGDAALYWDTAGSSNTAIGVGALYWLGTTGSNTAIGQDAGHFINGGGYNTSPNGSIYVGFNSQALLANDSNEIVIGNAIVGAGSNTAVLGNSGVTDVYLGGSGGAANLHTANQVVTSPGTSSLSVTNSTTSASLSLSETGPSGIAGLGGIFPNADILLGFSTNGMAFDSYSGPMNFDVNNINIIKLTAASATFAKPASMVTGTTLNGAPIPVVGTPTVGQAACIKAAGPPVVIGFCSTIVSSTGSCTCN